VIAVRRDGEILPSPDPAFVFRAGDILYLIGEREKVLKAIELLEGPETFRH
jgi:K+/H+ antiporter YhaU regulatory subunit KhtT